MDAQIAANAMAGAVVEVEACLPQVLPREAVQLGAGRADREQRARERDVALEHSGELPAHLRGRRADGDRPGDRWRIEILAARSTR